MMQSKVKSGKRLDILYIPSVSTSDDVNDKSNTTTFDTNSSDGYNILQEDHQENKKRAKSARKVYI